MKFNFIFTCYKLIIYKIGLKMQVKRKIVSRNQNLRIESRDEVSTTFLRTIVVYHFTIAKKAF